MGRDCSVGTATRYGLYGPGDRIPVGVEIFRARPDLPWGEPSLLESGTRSHPVVKRPGRGVDHPPHLVPWLKKEYNYTSTPLLGLRGLFKGELNLYLYLFLQRLAKHKRTPNIKTATTYSTLLSLSRVNSGFHSGVNEVLAL